MTPPYGHMNIPGYNPPRIINPWTYADYGNPPTRQRGSVGPVVFQTNEPRIRDPYLDAVVEALEGDAPTGDGAFVGGHLAPDSQMLGNYQDRSQYGGRLQRRTPLVISIQSIGVGDTQAASVIRELQQRLQRSPLFHLERIGWGTHRFENTIIARIQVRMAGTSMDALRADIDQALRWTNVRIGGANLQLARIAAAGPDALAGVGQAPQPDFGEDVVQALFSADPQSLVRPPPVVEPPWWERRYLGMPLWALGTVVALGGATVAWYTRRRR